MRKRVYQLLIVLVLALVGTSAALAQGERNYWSGQGGAGTQAMDPGDGGGGGVNVPCTSPLCSTQQITEIDANSACYLELLCAGAAVILHYTYGAAAPIVGVGCTIIGQWCDIRLVTRYVTQCCTYRADSSGYCLNTGYCWYQ